MWSRAFLSHLGGNVFDTVLRSPRCDVTADWCCSLGVTVPRLVRSVDRKRPDLEVFCQSYAEAKAELFRFVVVEGVCRGFRQRCCRHSISLVSSRDCL